MFRKITILRLRGNNTLLNFGLNWPAKLSHKHPLKGNIALLRYANVVRGNLSRQMMDRDGQSGYKTLMVPIWYCARSNASKWITDLTEIQYEHLTKTVQSMFPEICTSSSKQFWYWKQSWVEHDLEDGYQIADELSIGKDLKELEMMLYAHPVNNSRKTFQQSNISGLMLGNIGKRSRSAMKIIGDSKLVSLFQKQIPLLEWLEAPCSNCVLVMGEEVGDQELYRVKETILQMMELSQCDLVEVIQSDSHEVYAASWFYKLYSQWKDYIFSKQAI